MSKTHNQPDNPRYLILSDFDRTLFETAMPSPKKITVEIAYYLAINEIFGPNYGRLFLTSGLDSRAPLEIILDIFHSKRVGPEFDDARQKLFGYAKKFYDKGLVEKAEWNTDNPLSTITDMLVERKLNYLLGEIGTKDSEGNMWPTPCEGALEFLKETNKLREKGFPIDIGIISSGHNSFIRKSLEIWNTPQPQILVTDDDIRHRTFPKEPERRFKPGQFPLALAHHKWLSSQGLGSHDSTVQKALDTRPRIAYIGDDLYKDITLALNGKVLGYWFPHTSWNDITDNLLMNKDKLDGRPISEILPPKYGNKESFYQRGPKERL